MDDLDRLWELLRRHRAIRPDAPPLTDACKAAVDACVAQARPMTEEQRTKLLRLLRGTVAVRRPTVAGGRAT